MTQIEIVLVCAAWFVAGALGVFIGNSSDHRKGIRNDPESVWLVLLGPATLAAAILHIIDS